MAGSPHQPERTEAEALSMGEDPLANSMKETSTFIYTSSDDSTTLAAANTTSSSIIPARPLRSSPRKTPSWSRQWTLFINRLRRPLMRFLQFTSQISARNPKRTIVAVISLSFALAMIGLATNFQMVVDEQELWTPHPSLPVTFSDWIENESGFPKDARTLALFFHANGANIVNRANMNRVFQVMSSLWDLPRYDPICEQSSFVDSLTGNHTCQVYGVVLFWNSSWAEYNATVQSEQDLVVTMSNTSFPDGTPVIKDVVFGFPQYSISTNSSNVTLLSEATAYTIVVQIPDVSNAEELEYDIIQTLLKFRDDWMNDPAVDLRLEFIAQRSFSDESSRAIVQDLPLVPLVFILMSVFTSLVFFQRDRVKSRCFLGFLAVVSVLLSIITGYGLVFITGVPFTPLTELVPFIIFGIGLDDAYIILGEYIQTDPRKTTSERLQETMEEGGLSISITTATSAVAFASSCITTIPAVQWLCLYAFPTILVVYVYQITFFVACIALDDRRIQARRKDCCCCCFCCPCTTSSVEIDGTNERDGSCCPDEDHDDDDQKEEKPISERAGSPSAHGHDGNEKESEHFLNKFMLWYAEFLLRPWVKIIVLLLFALLFLLGLWSTSKMKQAFSFTDVLPADSYLTSYADAVTKYTAQRNTQPEVYFRHVNQSDPEIQQQMFEYIEDLVGLDSITKGPDYCWLRDFKLFVNYTNIGSWAFTVQLDWFLYQDVFQKLYGNDIVRDSSGNVVESRCSVNMDNIDINDVKMLIKTLKDERKVTSSQPLNEKAEKADDWPFFTYTTSYDIWEFYASAVNQLIFATWTTILAILAIAFFMMPHWSAAFILTPIIAVVYIELIGVMQWGGVAINAVSYVTIVMSIGLFVDYIMHVLLRYYECSGNRREKVVKTLTTMGASVLTGGISTFLGVIPLILASSKIFYTVFITFLGLVTLGIGHGLILVPVLMSYIGTEEEVDTHTDEDGVFRKARSVRTGELGQLAHDHWVVFDLDCSIHERA